MSVRRSLGNSALERLGAHLDDVARTCPACAHRDTDGHWVGRTTGTRVVYLHECPCCGWTSSRTIRLD